MTSKASHPAEMSEALRSLQAADGFIELPDFLRLTLYHDRLGYYRQDRQRVGRQPQSDFFTSTSLREAFREIVIEATSDILQRHSLNPSETDWVEIGAEPAASLLEGADHPFRRVRQVGVDDPVELSGQLVVFSNELFDAQPFRQLRFQDGRWREFGVRLHGDAPQWAQRSDLSVEAASLLPHLPERSLEGYTVDLPTGSRQLANSLLAPTWTGTFIAFDYGKTWSNIACETPQGTARAYRRHQLKTDILGDPGLQDITHHICWDHLEQELQSAGFESLSLQSQESFIARRAPLFLQKAFDPRRSSFDPLRRKLKELMHPALMGQKFQALSAVRR